MADKNKIDQLRRQAEKIVKREGNFPPEAFWIDEVARLLEELSMYQIHLEMQNDELQRSQQAVENEKNKYYDIFENAPLP
ncbi:MAG: hypothetical protein ACLFPE_14690, partial [Bacteroidales bacterium]